MNITSFKNILQGPFDTYLTLSQEIGGHIANHSILVKQAFHAQLLFLMFADEVSTPAKNIQMIFFRTIDQHITAIRNFTKQNRTCSYLNNFFVISESIAALGWVVMSTERADYVEEMIVSAQFYTRIILTEWAEKDSVHVKWVKSWNETLSELKAYVMNYHSSGLVWGTNEPLEPSNSGAFLYSGIDGTIIFAKDLKKMEMNSNLPTSSVAASKSMNKPPVFIKSGKKWLIANHKGNYSFIINNTELNDVAYIVNCVDSTVIIKEEIKSITLDSCKNTSIVFDTVSGIKFIKCQSVKMQVLDKVSTISINNTDGVRMYLNQESLNVKFGISKSSQMTILIPNLNGYYAEYDIPEDNCCSCWTKTVANEFKS